MSAASTEPGRLVTGPARAEARLPSCDGCGQASCRILGRRAASRSRIVSTPLVPAWPAGRVGVGCGSVVRHQVATGHHADRLRAATSYGWRQPCEFTLWLPPRGGDRRDQREGGGPRRSYPRSGGRSAARSTTMHPRLSGAALLPRTPAATPAAPPLEGLAARPQMRIRRPGDQPVGDDDAIAAVGPGLDGHSHLGGG